MSHGGQEAIINSINNNLSICMEERDSVVVSKNPFCTIRSKNCCCIFITTDGGGRFRKGYNNDSALSERNEWHRN